MATEDVRTTRLDDEIMLDSLRRPAAMKIDVQGAEMLVLRGATELLSMIDAVLVECSFVELYDGQALVDDVIGFLRDRGFRLTAMVAGATDPRGMLVQADLLFARRDV